MDEFSHFGDEKPIDQRLIGRQLSFSTMFHAFISFHFEFHQSASAPLLFRVVEAVGIIGTSPPVYLAPTKSHATLPRPPEA